MKEADDFDLQDRSLRLTTAVYYAVMLGALIIGLYGLFSLFWLATSQVARAGRVM